MEPAINGPKDLSPTLNNQGFILCHWPFSIPTRTTSLELYLINPWLGFVSECLINKISLGLKKKKSSLGIFSMVWC
jgi:hypothetical protein